MWSKFKYSGKWIKRRNRREPEINRREENGSHKFEIVNVNRALKNGVRLKSKETNPFRKKEAASGNKRQEWNDTELVQYKWELFGSKLSESYLIWKFLRIDWKLVVKGRNQWIDEGLQFVAERLFWVVSKGVF